MSLTIDDLKLDAIRETYKESVLGIDDLLPPTSFYNLEDNITAIVTPHERNEDENCALQESFKVNGSKLYIYAVHTMK